MGRQCLALDPDSKLTDRIVVFDAEDARAFLQIFLTTGIPLLVSVVIAAVILRKSRFKPHRIRSFLAHVLGNNPDNASFQAKLSLWFAFTCLLLFLPVVLLFVFAIQVQAATKDSSKLIGPAFVLLPLSYGSLLIGFLHWASQKWVVDGLTKQCLAGFVVLTYLFEVTAVVSIQPISYFSLSALLLSINGVVMVAIHFISIEGVPYAFGDWAQSVLYDLSQLQQTTELSRISASMVSSWVPFPLPSDPHELASDSLEGSLKVVDASSKSRMLQGPRWPVLVDPFVRSLCLRLYVVGVFVLVVYVVLTELLVHAALRSHCIAVAFTILVVDTTQYALVRSSVHVSALDMSMHALLARFALFVFSYRDYAKLECLEYSSTDLECCTRAKASSSPTWFIGHSIVYFLLGTLTIRRIISEPTAPSTFAALVARIHSAHSSNYATATNLNTNMNTNANHNTNLNSNHNNHNSKYGEYAMSWHLGPEVVLGCVYGAYLVLIAIIDLSNTGSMEATQFVYFIINVIALTCFVLISLAVQQFSSRCELGFHVGLLCACLVAVGALGGTIIWLATWMWMLFGLAICVPLLCAVLLMIWAAFAHNHHSLFRSSAERTPRHAAFLRALVSRGLPSADYQMMGMIALAVALLVGVGLLVGGVLGTAIAETVFVFSVTLAALYNYTSNNFRPGVFSSVSVMVCFVLLGTTCSVVWVVEGSLLLLTVGFFYLPAVALTMAVLKLSRDDWKLSREVQVQIWFSGVFVVVYGVVIGVWVRPWVVGATITFLWMMAVAKLFTYASAKSAIKRGAKPLSYSRLLVVPSVGYGIVVLASGQAVVASLVVLLALMLTCIGITVFRLGASKLENLCFSPFIFPVFRIVPSKDPAHPEYSRMKRSHKAVSFGFGALLLLVMIAHITTVAIHWDGGTAITCASIAIAFTFSLFLTRRSRTSYLRDVTPFLQPIEVGEAYAIARHTQTQDSSLEIARQYRAEQAIAAQLAASNSSIQTLEEIRADKERKCFSAGLAVHDQMSEGGDSLQVMLKQLFVVDKKINKLHEQEARIKAHMFLLLTTTARKHKESLINDVKTQLEKLQIPAQNLDDLSKEEIDMLLDRIDELQNRVSP